MKDNPRRVFPERRDLTTYKGLVGKAAIVQRIMDQEDVMRRFKERNAQPVAPPVVVTPEPRGVGAPSKSDRALGEFQRRRKANIALPRARPEAQYLATWDRDTFPAVPHPTWKTLEKLIAPAYKKGIAPATKRPKRTS